MKATKVIFKILYRVGNACFFSTLYMIVGSYIFNKAFEVMEEM